MSPVSGCRRGRFRTLAASAQTAAAAAATPMTAKSRGLVGRAHRGLVAPISPVHRGLRRDHQASPSV